MIKKGDKGTEVQWLQEGLKALGFVIKVDGDFGNKTDAVLKEFQRSRNLAVDGIAGIVTVSRIQNELQLIEKQKPNQKISERDIQEVSLSFGIDKAVIKAIMKVESGVHGAFLKSGRPTILFEGHIFWWRLAVYGINPTTIQGHSTVLYPRWTNIYYTANPELQWDRMEEAMTIHKQAALESSSWGLFQIMGYHWSTLDYKSIEDFVEKQKESEKNQLVAFTKFVTKNNLYGYLINKDWAGFARAYNGEGYKINKYDTLLEYWYNYFRENREASV